MSEHPSLQAQHDAFEAYKAARLKVDQTLDFKDARAAGAAWAHFVELFERESQAAPGRPHLRLVSDAGPRPA